MSLVLGPIHKIMYQRILLQDKMSAALLDLNDKEAWLPELRASVDHKYPAAEDVALESIIDPGNIHGWLSAAVETSEMRLSTISEALELDQPNRFELAAAVLNDLGQSLSLSMSDNTEEAHRQLSQLLLDGMPCDFPFKFDETDAESVNWTIVKCPHAAFWSQSELFYALRNAFVSGVLSDSPYVYEACGENKCCLRKEVSA